MPFSVTSVLARAANNSVDFTAVNWFVMNCFNLQQQGCNAVAYRPTADNQNKTSYVKYPSAKHESG